MALRHAQRAGWTGRAVAVFSPPSSTKPFENFSPPDRGGDGDGAELLPELMSFRSNAPTAAPAASLGSYDSRFTIRG